MNRPRVARGPAETALSGARCKLIIRGGSTAIAGEEAPNP